MLSFRDRFFTPKVAQAIVSPSAILAAGAGAALGILVASGPLMPVAAVGLGAAALAVRVGLAVPRAPREDRIDPFTVDEPWRRLTQDALAARRQFTEAVGRTRPGPIQDRLGEIGSRIEEHVREAWATARSGHALSEAYRRLDPAEDQAALAALMPETGWDDTTRATAASLQAQIDTARRMYDTMTRTQATLGLLNARLGEAVTRCIELSVDAYRPERFSEVESTLGQINDELDAVRQAIEVTAEVERSGSAATSGGAGG